MKRQRWEDVPALAPVVGILRNIGLNRWHPALFEPEPVEGDRKIENVSRYRSRGYLTEGYPSRQECIEGARELASSIRKHATCPVLLSLERDITWDGEDFPSMGVYFLIKGSTAIPVFRE